MKGQTAMLASAVLLIAAVVLTVSGGRYVEAAVIAGAWVAIAAVWFARGRRSSAR